MRTTINIPDGLLSDLDEVSEGKPRTTAIREAVEFYVKRKMREKLLSLRGRLNIIDVSGELESAELKDARG